MDIFAKIQDDRGQFSQSERRIADILVSDFEVVKIEAPIDIRAE